MIKVRKKWTQEDLNFIKKNKNKMNNKELGENLNRSYCSIQGAINRYKIKRSKSAIKKFQYLRLRKPIKYKKVKCQYPKLGYCWECISHYINPYSDYPMITRNNKTDSMSRYVWKRKFGKIPNGMCVCHKCDNTSCINPKHLFLGTCKDNSQDMIRKERGKGSLTNKQVIEIFKSKEFGVVLADEHNVSTAIISYIRNRKTYKEITANI